MSKVLVVFYSTYGHIYQMALAAEKGAKAAGAEVRVRRVQETLSTEILEKMYALEAQKAFAQVEVVSPADIEWADGVVWAAPTRFGNVAAQMKTFMDSLGQLWAAGACIGKVAGAITSTATQHGGNEGTITHGFWPFFAHLGFVIVGLPYSFQGQSGFEEVKGCSPYGASTIAGAKGERLPSATELAGAEFQGQHLAKIATALAAGKVHTAPAPEQKTEKKEEKKDEKHKEEKKDEKHKDEKKDEKHKDEKHKEEKHKEEKHKEDKHKEEKHKDEKKDKKEKKEKK
eukprot:TRINITY_DN325_c0_g2_i1.p1 TRINITY_DN325_c0_g2~~TRINITY_DN325_c0_g2_i1.p1  ORF type:complete len:286 (+),score=60.75 TRINITY_DN325_c0_g2_i1:85-942(+)